MRAAARWMVSGAIVAAVLLTVALARWYVDGDARPAPIRGLVMPDLSRIGAEGQRAFAAHCAACHGSDGAGSVQGPPLVHAIYRRAHHADVAFALAVRRGVVAHHWRFGDMPPQPTVTEPELIAITQYVREVQAANGID